MRLAVELYGEVIGTIEGDSRSFDFHPTDDGMNRFGVNSSILSVAIPLTPSPRRDQASRRRNWFAELLPEGDPPPLRACWRSGRSCPFTSTKAMLPTSP